MTIFINGKQKQVPRPQLIEDLEVDELLVARNADPIWLHQNGMWEWMPSEDAEPEGIPVDEEDR